LADSSFFPDTAMIFAAGFGKRMRPITNKIPKSLVKVNGKCLLDYALDNIAEAGIQKAVVNTHYLAEQIEQHLKERNKLPNVLISHEEVILETGGGIVKALLRLGDKPFFTINSDVIITSGQTHLFKRMADMWNPEIMDALMLLQDTKKAVGYDGQGGFNLADDGHLIKPENDKCDYVFTGVMLIKPDIFKDMEEKPFSVYRDFLHQKYHHNDGSLSRVFGLAHDSKWLHVGTPENIKEAEKALVKS